MRGEDFHQYVDDRGDFPVSIRKMEGIGEVPFDSLRWEFYRRVIDKDCLFKKIRGALPLQHARNLLTKRGSEGRAQNFSSM